MAFYVKIEGSKKLFFPIEDVSQYDGEQLSAIRQLQIKGFANIDKKTIDNQIELVYSVGGMQPLSQYLSNSQVKGNEKQLYSQLLLKVLKLMQEVEKYPLLSVANVVLDLDYLWIDAHNEVYCIYVPLMQDYQNLSLAWKKLIQDLLSRAESDEGMLFLTKQMRLAEGQSYFSVAELYKQVEMESIAGGRSGNTNWQASAPVSSMEMPNQPTPVQPAPTPVVPQAPQVASSFNQSPMPNVSHAAGQMPQAPTAPAPMPAPAQNSGKSNIQMVQAPNQKGQMPQGVKPPKAQGGGKFDVTKLIIGHSVILVIALAMIFGGVLSNEEGGLDIFNLLILLVIAIGGLLLIWLKWAVKSGDGTPAKAPKAPKQSKGKGKKATAQGAPGMAAPGVPGMNAAGNVPGMSSPGMGVPAMGNSPKPETPKAPAYQPQPVQPQPQSVQPQPMNPSFNQPVQAPMYESMGAMPEAAGTMVFSEGGPANAGGTVVLEQEKGVFLSVKSTNETRKLVKTPFLLGRNGDWKIADSAVSGRHCQIEFQGGLYYLVDIGSKNGTLLDGKRIEVNQYYPLYNGSMIRLGNTEIVFEVRE